jgi:hypothetical protein
MYTTTVRFLTPILVVFAAAAFGQPPNSTIGVFMDFDALPAPVTLKVMEDEVSAIMKPTGLKVDWRWLKDNRGEAPFAGLVVVRFKGKCRVPRWGEESAPAGDVTLGLSVVSEGRVLPFTEVECEPLSRTVRAGEADGQSALGRAMAHVVAHEIYHVVAHTTGHAVHGLAKATQTFQDLTGSSLGFQSGDGAAMRRGLLR